MLLCDWFVDSSGVSLSEEAVVLDIVGHLKEEDADSSVCKLENDCLESEHEPNEA